MSFRKFSIFIIVILISLFSCQRQTELKHTVLSLKEIHTIGELITAEYYGEVITSLSLIENNELDQIIRSDFKTVRDAYQKIPDHKKLVDRKISIKNFFRYKYFKKHTSQEVKEALRRICEITDKKKRDVLKNILNERFEEELTQSIKLDRLKNDLMYVGRGSVKVGYDLGNIEPASIVFSPNQDTLYLINVDPVETDLDINPWFYYPGSDSIKQKDNSLYGFQLLWCPKEKKAKLSDINKVKSHCKILLHQQAIDREIYEIAHKNAEAVLSSLFSMMKSPAGNEIKQVKILPSPFHVLKQDILYDYKITADEIDDLKSIMKDTIIDGFYSFRNGTKMKNRHLLKFLHNINEKTIPYHQDTNWNGFYAQKHDSLNTLIN